MAFSAIGTVARQPLTPSVVLLLRGPPGLPPPPPRQRTAISPDQSAWPRSPAPLCLLSLDREGGRCRRLQSRQSTSTSRIARTPFHPFRSFPRRELLRVALPLSRSGQLGFLGSGARCDFHRSAHPPVTIARTEVGYPDPRDPDTFCRRCVTGTAGGAALARYANLRIFYAPTARTRFRKARRRAPRFRGTFSRVASRDFPRRKPRSAKPKVPSVVGGSPGEGGSFGHPDKPHPP